ncbi:MAG: hypothetical protein ACHQYQ_10645, partial [Bacteriovoracales bacterium]
MKIYLRPLFFLTALFVSPNIFAADQIAQNLRVIEINYQKGESIVLNQLDGDEQAEVLNSSTEPNQYYLIRSGVKFSQSSNLRGSQTIFGALPETVKTCTGENLYDSSFTVGSNYLAAQEKKKLFNSCTKFKVEDLKKGKIEFDPKQLNCNLEKIDDSTVIISTGDCFFKAIPGQALKVKIQPDPKCTDRTFLAQNNLSPMELQTEWSSYLYPENEIRVIFRPIGIALWSKKLFINLNSGEELLKMVAKDVENQTIYRPEVYVFPDFMFSNLTINNFQDSPGSYADLSFLISNFGGKDFCDSGICSNYGNYDLPFAPFFILYEIDPKNGKKYEIRSFYLGDRIPGKWNGTLSQRINFKGFLFEVGKKYLMELTFSDPTNSYFELKKSYKSLLSLGPVSLGHIGRSTFGSLPTIGSVPSFSGRIGTIDSLSTSRMLDGIAGIPDGQIPRIVESFNDPTFPPEYTSICNKSMSFCQGPGIKDQEKISITFEVKGIGPDFKIDLGQNILVQRSGKLLPEY